MSPMNNRLMRPRASGGAKDADARAYIAAVELADGQALEPAVVKAIDDFVIGCKADDIWTKLKASCILMGARTLNGILTPLVGTAPTSNAFVGDATDYNRKTGLLGNGSTKRINTSRAGNDDGQNDKHQSVYASTAQTNATACFIGYFDGNDGNSGASRTDLIHLSGQGFFAYMHSLTGTSAAASASPGFIGVSRASSSAFTARFAGTTTTQNAASSPPSAINVTVFARNRESGTPDIHAAHRIAFYSVGSALDLALLDSRVSALYTAIGAASI